MTSDPANASSTSRASKLKALLQGEDSSIDLPNDNELIELLRRSGIWLKAGRQIFWIDESYKHCLTVVSKGLIIAWNDDPLYWHKTTSKPGFLRDPNALIEVDELRNIRWLDISVKFRIRLLSTETTYQILLHAKLEKENSGLEELKFKITSPKGEEKEEPNPIDFKDIEPGKWVVVTLGEYRPPQEGPEQDGEAKFCIYCHSDTWKRGLVIGGVSFKPKPPTS